MAKPSCFFSLLKKHCGVKTNPLNRVMSQNTSPAPPDSSSELLPLWKVRELQIGAAVIVLILGGLFFFFTRDTTPSVREWVKQSPATEIQEFGEPVSWFRSLTAPPADKIKKLISKKGLSVRKVILVEKIAEEDSTIWLYQVQVRSTRKLIKPQVVPFRPSGDLALVADRLQVQSELPAGHVYTEDPFNTMAENSLKTLEYKVVTSEEEVLVSSNPLELYLTEEEWKEKIQAQRLRVQQWNEQVELFRKEVLDWRAAEMARLTPPSKPSYATRKWDDGAGSGEPTKSATRIGGGAVGTGALGAGMGGAIGGRSQDALMGGLIGTGVGLLGGAIYDGVSKSNDRKKWDASEKARVAALKREYESELAAYQLEKKKVEEEAAKLFQSKLQQLANQVVLN